MVTADQTEVILFHWHPDGVSTQQRPHLHLGSFLLTPNAVMSHKAHVPTGRVSLESVIEHLITELRVVPVRADWQATLDKGQSDFVRWRTWG